MLGHERLLVVERKEAVGGERGGDGVLGGAAGEAVGEAENFVDGAADSIGGRAGEETGGGVVNENDFAGGIGDEDGFRERSERGP